jgi:hypothetical protein
MVAWRSEDRDVTSWPARTAPAVIIVSSHSLARTRGRRASAGTAPMGPEGTPGTLVVGRFTDPEGHLIGVAGTEWPAHQIDVRSGRADRDGYPSGVPGVVQPRELRDAVRELDERCEQFDLVEIDDLLARRAVARVR